MDALFLRHILHIGCDWLISRSNNPKSSNSPNTSEQYRETHEKGGFGLCRHSRVQKMDA
jgi:hypothetical protein